GLVRRSRHWWRRACGRARLGNWDDDRRGSGHLVGKRIAPGPNQPILRTVLSRRPDSAGRHVESMARAAGGSASRQWSGGAGMSALLTVAGVSKRYPGVLALDRVNLRLRAGEIHALVGENGAGKSSLIKILTGVISPDEGEILLTAKPMRSSTPS